MSVSVDHVLRGSRVIAADREAVFRYLRELDNHWVLLGAQVVAARSNQDNGGENTGATLTIRGPLPGPRRTVETFLTDLDHPIAIRGYAVAGKTRADIEWRTSEAAREAQSTVVELNVNIKPAGLGDLIVLLALRPWLARRCRDVLARLADATEGGG